MPRSMMMMTRYSMYEVPETAVISITTRCAAYAAAQLTEADAA